MQEVDLAWGMLISMSFYLIIPVEFIIAANHIQGVDQIVQAGQLLPFVAGLGVLCALGMSFLTDSLGPKQKEEPNRVFEPAPMERGLVITEDVLVEQSTKV